MIADLLTRCQWPAGGPVDLAVSGGADSLALLVLATAAGLEATAHHVDHGLRDGSQAEADVVAAAAERYGAGFRAHKVTVPPGANLEARARLARYGALPAGVLTGHTADDQAETVVLNLLWGAGIDGLAGMRNTAARRRPLLAIRREETHQLCAAAGLVPVADPTNDSLAFRRNAVRHRLLPLLAEIADRDPVPILVRQADLLGEDAVFLDALAAAIDPTDAAALVAAPPPLARRAIRRWLRQTAGPEHHPPSAAEVGRVMDVAAGTAVACEIGGGRRIARTAGRLRIGQHPAEQPPPGR